MNEIIQSINSALSLDSAHLFWFITRSAGLMAYLLLWLSTVSGLAVASKITDRFLHRSFTFDSHEFISLLALGFTAIHVTALLFDSYAPFSLPELLVPFVSTYRPFWVGIGILATYTAILVTATFYLRARIGYKTFRTIHFLGFAGYIGATLHGIFSGSDSGLPAAQLIYFETALAVVLLTLYWLWQLAYKQRPEKQAHGAPLPVRVPNDRDPR